VQRRGGQRRGVPLLTDHDHLQVVAGDRQPRVAGRVEAPFEVVALDRDRAGDDAGRRALRRWADVDKYRTVALGGQGRRGVEPVQPGACLGENLVDGTGAGRLHQSRPAWSTARVRSWPCSTAYRVIRVSTGAYTWMLTDGTVP